MFHANQSIMLQADETGSAKGLRWERQWLVQITESQCSWCLMSKKAMQKKKKKAIRFYKLLGSESRLDTGFCPPLPPPLVPSGWTRLCCSYKQPQSLNGLNPHRAPPSLHYIPTTGQPASLPGLDFTLGPKQTDESLSGILCQRERESKTHRMVGFYMATCNIKGTGKSSPTTWPGGKPNIWEAGLTTTRANACLLHGVPGSEVKLTCGQQEQCY